MRFAPQDEQFRAGVREWLEANLTGEFAGLRGAGGPTWPAWPPGRPW